MSKYKIICSKNNKNTSDIFNKLSEILIDWNYCEIDYEYLFIIGGDGTFISEIKPLLNKNIKVVLINAGKLGFYSYCDINHFDLCQITNDDNYKSFNYLIANQQPIINEIIFYSHNAIESELYINNKHWFKSASSGFIISSSYGSSGSIRTYNGPLIDTSLKAYCISEIFPVNTSIYRSFNCPIIIGSTNELTINYPLNKNMDIIIDNISTNLSPPVKINMVESNIKLYTNQSIFAQWKDKLLGK